MSTARNKLRKLRRLDRKARITPYLTQAQKTVNNAPTQIPYIVKPLKYLKAESSAQAQAASIIGAKAIRQMAQSHYAEVIKASGFPIKAIKKTRERDPNALLAE